MKRGLLLCFAFVLVVQPAALATRGRVHDYLAGSKVDVCLDGVEVLSDAVWDSDVPIEIMPNGVFHRVDLRVAEVGECSGALLDTERFYARGAWRYRISVIPNVVGEPALDNSAFDTSRTPSRMAWAVWCHYAALPAFRLVIDGGRYSTKFRNAADKPCVGFILERGSHRFRVESVATGERVFPSTKRWFKAGYEYHIFMVHKPSGTIGARMFSSHVGIRQP